MPLHLAQIIEIAARPANRNRDLIGTDGIEMLGLLSDDLVKLETSAIDTAQMLTIDAADVLRVSS